MTEKNTPIPGLPGGPNWLNALVQIIPTLKNRIQLVGFVVLIGLIVVSLVYVPGNIPVLIVGGSLGIGFLIFGQAFAYLHAIREKDRALYIIALVVIFLIYESQMAVLFVGLVAREIPPAPEQKVSISGRGDFSQLSCTNGNKVDTVRVDQTYTFNQTPENYHVAVNLSEGQSVELIGTENSPSSDPEISEAVNNVRTYRWNFTPKGPTFSTIFRFENANGGKREGISFPSAYPIEDIDFEIVLPPGKAITNVKFDPSSVTGSCRIEKPNEHLSTRRLRCHNPVNQSVTAFWTWDVWDNCVL